MAAATTRVRVYVGGLPADATTKELSERFSRFVVAESCRLESVELLPPKGLFALNSDATHRGFAYLTLSGEAASAATEKLVKTYNKTKWRGSVLRVEIAKPDYLEKLELEWQEQREQRAKQSAAIAEAHGLAAVVSDREPLDVCVGGVTFCGTKRTTFDYADLDLDAAFARKAPVVAAAKAPVAVPVPGDATETEGSDSDNVQDDDDDADYWVTSGDESEQETLVRPVPVAVAPPVAAHETEDSSSESEAASENASDEEDAAASSDNDDDAVAMDDVEAFVQQILDEEKDAEAASAAAKTLGAPAPEDEAASVDPVKQREEANARRIAALEAKRKQQQQALAATKIDLSAKANNTKITFDDSGNEREAGESDDERDGAAITNWLDSSDDEDASERRDFSELHDGSDDDDDAAAAKRRRNALDFAGVDGDDDDDAAKAFAVRPEFLGARGKKLFELQKRFGGDQRFRMDARFIDDEENEYGGTDGLVPDDDDDDTAMGDGPTGELQSFQQEVGADEAAVHEREWMAEQDAALSVIATIFPDVDVETIKYRLRVKVKKDPIKEAAWMGQLKRYDPRDAHARHAFELPMDNAAKAAASGKSAATTGDASKPNNESDAAASARETKDVLIGGDRFFETSSSLGSLFTRVRKNSEDGIAGEAALDGVFGAGRSGISDSASGDADESTQGAGAATFKLSSLFDFQVEGDDVSAKPSRLAAMGETLFEANADDDASGEKPWHFTQSFFSDDKDDDVAMDTDQDDHDDDDDDDAAGASDNDDEDAATANKKKVLKKSLAEFLAFGEAFGRDVEPLKASEWTERRKKLTMDYKRKRKDALRNKKKLQQRLQKQHKKHKTVARA